jgi:arabinofuranosyltransferase
VRIAGAIGRRAAPRAVGRVEQARPGSLRRAAQWVVLTAPIAAYIGAGWAHRWITDDGFIYLRVVQQIRAGNGPVFNDGQRVEAFTGPLWLAFLTAADIVTPIRLEWIAVVLGLVACACGLAMAIAGARRLTRSEPGDAFLVPFGVLVFVAILPSWVFATSGLETGLSFAWLGLTFWVLVEWAQSGRRLPLARAFLLGLGWLVRPELALFSAAFLAIVLGAQWHADGWRDRGRLVLAITALPVAYQVFRMGFYGSLVTNTAIAKEGTSTNWGRGWDYFRDFADPYWLWVPGVLLVAGGYVPLVLALLAARKRRALLVVGSFLIVGILTATYVVAVGGDYIHGRLFLPSLFAVCAPVAVVPATRRHLAALLIAPWVVTAVLILRPPQTGSAGFFPRLAGHITVDDFGWGTDGPRRHWYTGPAFYFQARAFDPNFRRSDLPLNESVATPSLALLGIGVASYALGPDFAVVDVFGLADPFASHLISTPSRSPFPRLPGHEKPMPAAWLAARITRASGDPDPDDFPEVGDPLIPVTSGKRFRVQVAWARAALRCPEIRRLVDAADERLTPGRFVDNFVSSFSNTRFRIPADPEHAYHRFCGPGTPREVRDVTTRARDGSAGT